MTLYIIGNGFDRHHKLDTRYLSFGLFLRENYHDTYELLTNYFGLPDLDPSRSKDDDYWEPLWAEFEKALAGLDFKTVLEDNSDSLADVGSPDFRDRDWYTYQIDMEMIVDDLTVQLFKAFKEFILLVEFPEITKETKLALEHDAVYLNFNYTDTLEKYYGIPQEKILYIHKKAKSDDTLILGHGITAENFVVRAPKPPEDLTAEELIDWQERMSDNYDLSYELGQAEILGYFEKSYKPTSSIIDENEKFFLGIGQASKVIILGHSLSDVDRPYLLRTVQAVQNKDITWITSFHSDTERESRINRLVELGLKENQVELIKMNNLLEVPDLKAN